jgi:hypothetical protein
MLEEAIRRGKERAGTQGRRWRYLMLERRTGRELSETEIITQNTVAINDRISRGVCFVANGAVFRVSCRKRHGQPHSSQLKA